MPSTLRNSELDSFFVVGITIVFTGACSWFTLQQEWTPAWQSKLSENSSKRRKPWEKSANYIFWPCYVRDGITHISDYSWSLLRAWIGSGEGEKSGAFIVPAKWSYRMKYIPCNAFEQILWFLAAFACHLSSVAVSNSCSRQQLQDKNKILGRGWESAAQRGQGWSTVSLLWRRREVSQ